MIEAVLFDLGGVFTDSPFEAVRITGAELGIDLDLALRLVFGPYDQDTDHPWHRLERGELSFPAARQELIALAASHGVCLDPLDILSRMSGGTEAREVVVDSSEVGRRKPDPRFYQLALERLGNVAPEHCVFLDDFEGNVAAATALGMRGILVGLDRQTALAQLDAILAEGRAGCGPS